MPPKSSSAVNVPSYAELLSSSRKTSKTKSGLNGEKKKKKVLEESKKSTNKDTSGKHPPVPPPNHEPILEVVNECRVVLASSGLFGTVRFVGEASFQAGTWVGIELDSEQVRQYVVDICVLV